MIHFAKGCSACVRGEIKEILEVHNETLSEKYLGMRTTHWLMVPSAISRMKKVQGWMQQCLSAGGKEVLIKAIAQAIPTYSMSCFKLPRGLCKHIDGVFA